MDLIPLPPSEGEGPWDRAVRNATVASAQLKLYIDKVSYHTGDARRVRAAEGSASQRGGDRDSMNIDK